MCNLPPLLRNRFSVSTFPLFRYSPHCGLASSYLIGYDANCRHDIFNILSPIFMHFPLPHHPHLPISAERCQFKRFRKLFRDIQGYFENLKSWKSEKWFENCHCLRLQRNKICICPSMFIITQIRAKASQCTFEFSIVAVIGGNKIVQSVQRNWWL